MFSKYVPTNIVITNCESSSNNETQFNSLFEALKRKQILNFVIDEKKCGTTKNMISYIQKAVNDLLGHDYHSLQELNQGDHSDEEIKVVVSSDNSSSQDSCDDDEEDEQREMNSVSPRKGQTVDAYDESTQKNETIAKQYELGRSTQSDLSKRMDHSVAMKSYKEDYEGDYEGSQDKISSSATDKIGFSGVKKLIQYAQ